MEKLNILMIYSAKGFGGLPRNLSLIASRLDSRRFRLHVGLMGDPGDKAADFRSLLDTSPDVLKSFTYLGDGKTFDFEVAKQISNLIDEHSIYVLSCHGYKADLFGFIVKHYHGKKVKLFTIAHGWVSKTTKLKLYQTLDKFIFRFFDKVVLVSEKQFRELGSLGLDKEKVEVINNAVDIETFSFKGPSRSLLIDLDIDPNDKKIGFAGRLSKEKGVDSALEIFKEVLKEVPDALFVVVGDGPDHQILKQQAEQAGISSRVIFTGYRKDMKAIYSILDVYLSCSQHEGLPNSVLEAMASGVPCVLSDIPGHNDIVVDGENGFLIDPRNAASSAFQLVTLLNDSSLAGNIKDEARRILQKKFSISSRVQKLEKAYLSLVDEKTMVRDS